MPVSAGLFTVHTARHVATVSETPPSAKQGPAAPGFQTLVRDCRLCTKAQVLCNPSNWEELARHMFKPWQARTDAKRVCTWTSVATV